MYEQAAALAFYTETLLHAGSGATVGAVDLPVQRERHTDFPVIPGSSIKGSLRALAEEKGLEGISVVFGPTGDHAADHAGALAFTDARLLLFPVRSVFDVFAWTTCSLVLEAFSRARQAAGLPTPPSITPAGDDQALVAPGTGVARGERVMLDEFTYTARETAEVRALADFLAQRVFPQSNDYAAWRSRLPRQLVILPDEDWRDFVTYSTEVIARIKLDPTTGTTSGDAGNLWYEEHVPSDALFWALALAARPRVGGNGSRPAGLPGTAADVLRALDRLGLDRLQLGGDETVGRGLVKVQIERAVAAADGGHQ